ncbi:peptidyl-tRNA hydrolase PTH2-domain-containing protein [Naematelia encephala]|uniref:peptidyl-tRNA hydrolase n=1 Tax=Naematelia encephala TaxID=71784 RepID=A0A1Y2B9Z0_9TREE|nr:peptidyl-tRNA hydrolase PTH2-domain-containing protein [Naematelia encephala]
MSLLRDSRMTSLIQPAIITLVAFALGYQTHSYLSPRRSLSTSSSSASSPKRSKTTEAPASPLSSDGTDTDSDAEDAAAALASDLSAVKSSAMEEMKLVLVVNDSLKMTKGKIAAQAGHATLACAFMVKDQAPRLFNRWQRQGQPKIAVRCVDTAELEALAAQARSMNLCARTIQDAGRTQVAPGSKTILGIGPGPARLINQVTGKLRLL